MSAAAQATVLVVDDEPRSVELIARILGEEFDVRTAHSARTACPFSKMNGCR